MNNKLILLITIILLTFSGVNALTVTEKISLSTMTATDDSGGDDYFCNQATEKNEYYSNDYYRAIMALGNAKDELKHLFSDDSDIKGATVYYKVTDISDSGSADVYVAYNCNDPDCSKCMSYEDAFAGCEISDSFCSDSTSESFQSTGWKSVDVRDDLRDAFQNNRFFSVSFEEDSSTEFQIAGSNSADAPYLQITYEVPAECTEGMCCNINNGTFMEAGTVCNTIDANSCISDTYLSLNYYQYTCSGTSSVCEDYTLKHSGLEYCQSPETCVTDQCYYDYSCTEGTCCDLETQTMKPQYTVCDEVETISCRDDTELTYDFYSATYVCSGTSQTCPDTPKSTSSGGYFVGTGNICLNDEIVNVGDCSYDSDCNYNTEKCVNYQCTEVAPQNIEFSIGDTTVYSETEMSGEYNISLTDALNNELETCVEDADGYCTIYVNYEFEKPGYLTIYEPVVSFIFDDLSLCEDGLDNDNDGYVDSEDNDCLTHNSRENNWDPGNTECSDGLDNDNDGLVDLADSSCDSLQDNTEGELFTQYSMTLNAGSQFVSFPLLPTDTTIESVFGNDISKVKSIKTIEDGSLKEWSANIESLSSLTVGIGYVIDTESSITLNIEGIQRNCLYDINQGYNYIGVIGERTISSTIFAEQTVLELSESGLTPISGTKVFNPEDAFVIQSDTNVQIECD